jgi:hypothetical protein
MWFSQHSLVKVTRLPCGSVIRNTMFYFAPFDCQMYCNTTNRFQQGEKQ